jgi:3-hydroxyacyl-CoA dehydrogenase
MTAAIKSGRISAGRPRRRTPRPSAGFSTDIARRLPNTDLVIEAVFEDMAVKKERCLTQARSRDACTIAVLATNTSYLDIDAMVADLARPQNVVGLHFFSPANIMKLLEIVKARQNSARCAGHGRGRRQGAAQDRRGLRGLRWVHRQPHHGTLQGTVRIHARRGRPAAGY